MQVNTYNMSRQRQSSVALDQAGNFVIAWESFGQDGDGYGVFAQRYAGSGAPLGPEFRVNTVTTSWQNRPSVAADAAGDFVVVWTSENYGLFAQRYSTIVPVEFLGIRVE